MNITDSLRATAAWLDEHHLPDPFAITAHPTLPVHVVFRAINDTIADALMEQVGGTWTEHRYSNGRLTRLAHQVVAPSLEVVVSVHDVVDVPVPFVPTEKAATAC